MIRTCVLCDQKVKSSHKLCTRHFLEYRSQMHEPWFLAMIEEQAKQDQIDRYESYVLPFNSAVNIYGIQSQPELLTKREVGRPITDWRIIEQVLRIYDESVDEVAQGKRLRPKSLRCIARELNNKIGYVTVRNILLEYRHKEK